MIKQILSFFCLCIPVYGAAAEGVRYTDPEFVGTYSERQEYASDLFIIEPHAISIRESSFPYVNVNRLTPEIITSVLSTPVNFTSIDNYYLETVTILAIVNSDVFDKAIFLDLFRQMFWNRMHLMLVSSSKVISEYADHPPGDYSLEEYQRIQTNLMRFCSTYAETSIELFTPSKVLNILFEDIGHPKGE
jgi:hypothetical protein